MNHYGNSGFGLYQSQPGIGRDMSNTIVDDHRSVYSTDSNTNRSPPSVGHGVPEAITPAQAYARSVKTGEPYDRTLHHTIERKQPERKTEPQVTPSHLSNLGAGRGASFAQHLYASAVKNKSGSSAPSLGNPSHEHATSFSSFSSIGASLGSRSIPNRNTSPLPSSFDSSSEVPESFNPADLYNSSVARHGSPSRNSAMPGSSSARPLPMMLVSDTASFVSRQSGRPQSRGSHHQSQGIPHPETQNSRPVSYRPQVQPSPLPPTVELQANRFSTVNTSFIEAPPDVSHFPSPANAGDTISPPPPPFVEQSADAPHQSSPPPFEENERLTIPIVADVPSVSVTARHQESQLEGSLVSPPDTAHEAVPTYTLVDEEQPPAFDDLHPASNTGTPAEVAPAPQHEVLPVLSEVVAAPSSSSASPPPPAPPSPFVSDSKAYLPEKAPAYTLLDPDGTSSFVGTSRSTRQSTKTQLPLISTDRTSNLPRPDPPSMLSTNSRMFSQSPPMSPLTSPVNAPPSYGTAFPSTRPSVPSSARPPSVLSARSVDSQSARVSYGHSALRSNANNMPPPVMYHNKPIAQQARQTIIPPATQSVARPLGTQGPPNVDALTHSISRMMEEPLPSDARSLRHDSGSSIGSSTRQSTLGPSGSHQVLPASHSAWAPRTADSYGRGVDRLLQEAYQLTRTGSDGEARRGIQGSGPGSLPESHQGYPGFAWTNDPHTVNHPAATQSFSSQHSPGTVPYLGPVPPRYPQEGPQTESVRATKVGSTFTQFGGTAAPSSTRLHYSVSVPPTLQSSYYSIDRDVHGPGATSGSVHFQSPKSHPQQHSLVANMDPMQRGSHVLPPPLPPPIVAQASRPFQMPQASLYSQDSAKYQVGPSTRAPVLNSNDLARKFALDALLTPAGPPAYAFHGTNQR